MRSVLLLHLSFLLIIAGGLLTFFFGQQGYIHLKEGETVSQFVRTDNREPQTLPFTLRLDSFRVAHYPGTDIPQDYVSHVTLFNEERRMKNEELSLRPLAPSSTHIISMNQILSYQGYRFCQASYDEDGRGSWLTVNRDPWGIGLVYAGYVLFGLSMLWMLLERKGKFRRMLRHPLLRRGGFVLLLLGAGVEGVQAEGKRLPVIVRHQADSLARVQVVYQGRLVPLNTPARDFVTKLTGRPTYRGLTPEQVLGGWLLHPEVWKDEPMIRIKHAGLRRRLGIKGEYASLNELFDHGELRIKNEELADSRGLQKAVVETDEKVGLILMLTGGTLFRSRPADLPPLSDRRVEAELLHNRVPFTRMLFIGCLTAGMLGFGLTIYRGTRRSRQEKRWLRWTETALTASLYAACAVQAVAYGLRWYVGGRIPLSNGQETMLFLSLAVLAVACVCRKWFAFVVPFGFLLSGCVLLVAYMGESNPPITPLMPVLASPWLSSHVSLIMVAYALMAFMMLSGVLAICLRRQAVRLMLFSRVLLYPATFCLGVGICLGSVWANESWGRYWGWDPKEVWALITFLVYGAAFHVRSLRSFRRPMFFHLYMIAAFACVLFTYFGVNYLLEGMHSYA